MKIQNLLEAVSGHSIQWSVWKEKSAEEKNRLLRSYPKLKIIGEPKPSKLRIVKKKLDLPAMARKIQDIVGSSFPDGDPIDGINSYFKKLGIPRDEDTFALLDKIVKKHIYKKGYYKWLEQMWDDVADDKLVDNVTRENNPWR